MGCGNWLDLWVSRPFSCCWYLLFVYRLFSICIYCFFFCFALHFIQFLDFALFQFFCYRKMIFIVHELNTQTHTHKFDITRTKKKYTRNTMFLIIFSSRAFSVVFYTMNFFFFGHSNNNYPSCVSANCNDWFFSFLLCTHTHSLDEFLPPSIHRVIEFCFLYYEMQSQIYVRKIPYLLLPPIA